jgi:signal transduction histidine kinase
MRWGIALAVPLAASDGRPIGLLILGEKKSGIRYSREDADLLMNLTTHAGLEIDRIRLQRMVFRTEVEAARLRELNDLKTGFVDSVSHEFKTPVTGILLFVEQLSARLGVRNRKAQEDLRVIAGEARRLDRMVTNILDSRRIERGEKHFRMAPADLGALTDEACQAMKYSLMMNGFSLTVAGLRGGKGIPIEADPDAVIEAITNLIENSMKYSGKSRRIAVRCAKEGSRVLCSVRDWGVGVSPEALPRIFEKHYRDPASGSVAEGFGIGLSVVDAIMRAHGGGVEVKSFPGKGSTFTLVFPLHA